MICESLCVFAGERVGGDASPVLHVPPHVHPRATDDNGHQALRQDFFGRGARIGEEVLIGVVKGREHQVHQVVRDALPLLKGYLGGAHVQAFVHLNGVCVDDLASERLGELDG